MLRKGLGIESLETRRLLASLLVTSTADVADLDPGDGVCEISVGGPCTLRAAIQEANALPNPGGPDEIILPSGTYSLSIEGIDDQQSLTGDLDITGDLILRGDGSIIDGGGIDRVLDIVRGTVNISGVTIRGGLILDDEDPVEGSGGGIRNEGDLTITDSTISGNVATVGAGVANYNGTLQISRSVVSGNGDDSTSRGGGVSNESNYDPASLQITASTITNNRADTGGGISIRSSYDGLASATLSSSTLSGNLALQGGGISNRSVADDTYSSTSNLTIRNSTISGNVANDSGGGIHSQADSGGNASVDIANSTIVANAATMGDGGGIRQADGGGTSLILESVIVSGNAASGVGPDLASSSSTTTFSLVQNAQGHTVTDGVGGNIVGRNPLLGPLSDNGGITLTHTLLAGSPAIDQGSSTSSLSSDQRGDGFARTADNLNIVNASDGTDIGAVELVQVGEIADLSLTQVVDDPNPVLGQDVTFTITLTNDGPDRATNIEVFDLLPLDLVFTSSNVSEDQYDDLDGVWFVDNLNAGASAVLRITATVDSSDTITNTAEIIASDQSDPDSTPDNGISDEDDQVSLSLGTCLSGGPLQVGMNLLTYSCLTPGSVAGFVRGSERGTTTFAQYGTTVDIADAHEVAIGIADSLGFARVFFELTDSDRDQTILVQAFEMFPGAEKSNTLSLEVGQAIAISLTNQANALDVNADSVVSALDALVVINYLSRDSQRTASGSSARDATSEGNGYYLDTNADSRVTALDALLVINALSRRHASPGDGEAADPIFSLSELEKKKNANWRFDDLRN